MLWSFWKRNISIKQRKVLFKNIKKWIFYTFFYWYIVLIGAKLIECIEYFYNINRVTAACKDIPKRKGSLQK